MTNHASLSNAAPGHTSLGDFIHSTPEMLWLDEASCGSVPLDQLNMFFVEAGRTISPAAVAMCRQCPVRQQCLDHAYANEIVSGYFGGVSPGQRRVLSHAEASLIAAG